MLRRLTSSPSSAIAEPGGRHRAADQPGREVWTGRGVSRPVVAGSAAPRVVLGRGLATGRRDRVAQ
ncbi:hypothetical protein FRAHR75_70070 [Frankia sp. Hr75.2]|nr:hypothetical protein FRAHR75_70070 [Frankia sp. Hr75.2]SQD94634.1 hypothetical protein FMEAI12_2680043 [Parafrankia sp. Ea1.12]